MSSGGSEHVLLAQAEVFPLASEASFQLRLCDLERHNDGALGAGASQLYAHLEEHLRLRAGGMSLDALAQIRDYAWFGSPDTRKIRIDEHLARVARRYVSARGPRYELLDVDVAPDVARRFRWLTLLIPIDLLLAAEASSRGVDPVCSHVGLVSSHLAPILDRPPGLVQTHLHVSGALDFQTLWSALMGSIDDASFDHSRFDHGPGMPFGGGENCLRKLLSAALSRILLAGYCWERELSSRVSSFDEYLIEFSRVGLRKLRHRLGLGQAEAIVRQAIGELTLGRNDASVAALRYIYGLIARSRRRSRTESLGDVVAADPLTAWLGRGSLGGAGAEASFLSRALRLSRANTRDRPFATLLFQYIRVRNSLYQYVTQQPGTSGLDWFIKHFNRIYRLRGAIDPHLLESALLLDQRAGRLAASELRAFPADTWQGVASHLRGFTSSARIANRALAATAVAKPIELGIIYHLVKDNFTMPSNRLVLPLFRSWYQDAERRTLAIAKVLHEIPASLVVLRGFDVAGRELGLPLWPILPLAQKLRAAADRAAERLGRRRPSWGVTSLRFTCHAGEDYRRLSEGLRRIDETIEFRLIRSNDRLGHAIALADTPLRAGRLPVGYQPAGERLDDLLWELARYESGDVLDVDGRHLIVSRQARELALRIFGQDCSVADLLRARQDRHDPAMLRRLGYPRSVRAATPKDSLLAQHLSRKSVVDNCAESVRVVGTGGEARFLARVQTWLRTRLNQLCITVETNPSSNLIVGDFDSIGDHPAFRLQALPGTSAGDPPVLVTVNSDDPLTFATCLSDEFAHMFYAMIHGGVATQHAIAWLDEAIHTAVRSRFTLPASASDEVLSAVLAAFPRSF